MPGEPETVSDPVTCPVIRSLESQSSSQQYQTFCWIIGIAKIYANGTFIQMNSQLICFSFTNNGNQMADCMG